MRTGTAGDTIKSEAVFAEDLSFSLGDRFILKNINLSINKGEFVGLIGPNGAGKTTLLKCLSGLIKCEGRIFINGTEISKLALKDIAREIAFLHQKTAVAFPFTVLDVVLMGRYPHKAFLGWENADDINIAKKYLAMVDAEHLEMRPVTQLSGGETQRIMLARVLAQESRIIFLDEPTANLDIAHVESIFRLASELCSSGRTVITAVHDLKIAAGYCSRMVLMKQGSVFADGKPEEVLSSRNLSEVYDVNALVYKNRLTEKLDYFIHNKRDTSSMRVHVIGGGGSAAGVIRLLFENGCSITAGVFAHGDSDIAACEAFNADHIVCEPFSEIADVYLAENIRLIEAADLTILCDMPFGNNNIRNLEAAAHAERLAIIEDGPVSGRDFTGGRALDLYGKLKKRSVVVTSASLHEVI